MSEILQKTHLLAADQRAMTYLDDYILLETEHQKHLSLYGEKPDYTLIIQKSMSLLEQGSGHFLVIVSLCNAWLQTRQWAGFIESLAFLNHFCRDEWPRLFPGPERLKGRVQMLDWLIERWHQFMETHPTQGLSLDSLQKMQAGLADLQTILNLHCGEEVNLITIIKPFETALDRLRNEKQARDTQQKMEQERQAEAALQATLQQSSEPISQDEYLNHLNTEELYEYASTRLGMENLKQLEDASQRYAILKHHRAMAWWGPYPHLDALDWEAFSQALRLKAEQAYLDAFIAFETLFLQQPRFLDLQYHLCDCLELLEDETDLISMLQYEMQAFCAHHPELEHTTLDNKILACNKQTRSYFNVFNHPNP